MSATAEDVICGRARWSVVHGDSAEVIKTIQVVDHVITDPPYDLHTQKNMISGSTLKRVDLSFAPISNTDHVHSLLAVAKRWVICFCTIEDVGHYADSAGDCWVRGGVWFKPNSMGQLSGDRPAAAYECLAIMHRVGKKRWNGRGSFAHWTFNGTRGVPDRHSTQKPIELMLDLVEKFTDVDDLVLDPYCGAATTGVACLRLGRRFIGIEQQENYAELSRERLSAEDDVSTLQARRAGQMGLFATSGGKVG